MNKKYFIVVSLFLTIFTGCTQQEQAAVEEGSNDDIELYQAELKAYIGQNKTPIRFGDELYVETPISSPSYIKINRTDIMTRKELLKGGYNSYCRNSYALVPEPKIINYDTGEREKIEEKPKELIAFECQTIRQPDEDPNTYQSVNWWYTVNGRVLTQNQFNELTGRVVIHDYSKPWP